MKGFSKRMAAWATAVFFAGAVFADLEPEAAFAEEGGRLAASATWTAEQEHRVVEAVYVPSGVTLTLTAGAHVVFAEGTFIYVENGGKLNVVGADGADVVLDGSLSENCIRRQSSSATFTDNGWIQTRGFDCSDYPTVALQNTVAVASRDAGMVYIIVSVSGATRNQSFTVDWEAEDGTARCGRDYGPTRSGRVTWSRSSDGQKLIAVPLLAEERADERRAFTVRLTAVRGANAANASATAEIEEFAHPSPEWASATSAPGRFACLDWEEATLAEAEADDTVAVEGGRLRANTTWTDAKTHLVVNPVYVPSGVTLTLSAGALVRFCKEAYIKVEDGGNLAVVGEDGRDVILDGSLSENCIRRQSSSAAFTDNGWIQTRGFDYGGYPTVAVSNAVASRDAGTLYLAVSVSGATRDQSFTVDWEAEDGTARCGRDYGPTRSGRVTWSRSSDGQKLIAVPLLAEERADERRAFTVRLTAVRGANAAQSSASATIVEFGRLEVGQAKSATATLVDGVAERRPFFVEEVEPIRYDGAWDDSGAAVLQRVSVELGDGQRVVLKEAGAQEAGSVDLRPADCPIGWHALKHETLDASGAVVASRSKAFCVLDAEQVALHGGPLAEKETWSAEKTHLVWRTVEVPSSTMLSLEPGAVVKFLAGSGMAMEAGGGTLAAGGVVFTHIDDDTAGGDTLNDGAAIPAMDAYTLKGNWSFDSETERRYRTWRTALSGTISGTTALLRGSTYSVSGTLTVASGGALVIPEGTVVKMGAGASIVVNAGGTLLAKGTRAAPVVITSVKDDAFGGDTNGDGDATSPAGGDWQGIWVSGTAEFSYATLMYGGKGNERGIVETRNSGVMTLENCLVAHAEYDGIWNWGGSIVARNTVVFDTGYATAPWRGTRNEYVNCVFYGNNVGLAYWSAWAGKPVYRNCIFAACGLGWCETGSRTYQDPQFREDVAVEHSLFWNPEGYGLQSCERVGADSNLWGDPCFADAEAGDFRILAGSPCIDAGDSAVAPEKDRYGQPRIGEADIGIAEFQLRGGSSEFDLRPSFVRVDGEALPGQAVVVRWEDLNAGSARLDEPWRDTLTLVNAAGQSVPLGDFVVRKAVAAGGSVANSAVFSLPALEEGEWFLKLNVNSYHDIFEGSLTDNNALVSATPIAVRVEPTAASAGDTGFTLPAGGVGVLKLVFAEEDAKRMVRLSLPAGVSVRYGHGFMPGAENASGTMVSTGRDVMFRAEDGAATVYVTLEGGAGSWIDVRFEPGEMAIAALSQTALPTAGEATFTVSGAGFGAVDGVWLVCGEEAVEVERFAVLDEQTVVATVEGAKLTDGRAYAVRLAAGETALESFETMAAEGTLPPGRLEARLNVPEAVRHGRVCVGYLEYGNAGGSDLPAPMFKLYSANEEVGFFADEAAQGETVGSLRVAGLGGAYPKGVLRPGERCRMPFKFRVLGGDYTISFAVLDASSAGERDSVYGTWGELALALADAATQLNGVSGTVCDYGSLYANAMKRGYGLPAERIAGRLLHLATDAPMAGETLLLLDAEGTTVDQTVTGADGAFRFDDLVAGERYRISAISCQAEYPDVVAGDARATSVTVYGAGFATLRCVIDGDVAAESVQLVDPAANRVLEMEQAEDGNYAVGGLEDGTYAVRAHFGGFYCALDVPATVDEGLVSGGVVHVAPIGGGRIDLALASANPRVALAGVAIGLADEAQGFAFKAVSDENGHVVAALPPGTYAVSVEGECVLEAAVVLEVAAGTTVEQTAALRRNPVEVFPSMGPAPLQAAFALRLGEAEEVASCLWDFDADGVWDASGLDATRLYEEAGVYSVKCRLEFADGGTEECFLENAIDVWDGMEWQGAEGSVTLDMASGYEILSADDEKLVLAISGKAPAAYLQEGGILIDPDHLSEPRRILSIEVLDAMTLEIATEFVPAASAYAYARIASVASRASEGDSVSEFNLLTPEFVIPIKEELWGTDNDGANGNVKVGIDATFSHRWAFCVKEGSLQQFEFRGSVQGKAEVVASAATLTGKEKSARKKKAWYKVSRHGGRPATKKVKFVDKVFPAGTVPLWVTGAFCAEVSGEGSLGFNISSGAVVRYDGKAWTHRPFADCTVWEISGTLSAKTGFEIDVSVGAGKKVDGARYGVSLADLTVEAGLETVCSVTLRGSSQPDTWKLWAGPYLKGAVSVMRVSLGNWADSALISIPFEMEGHKAGEWTWETPMPDFVEEQKGGGPGYASFRFTSTTAAPGSSLLERQWRCGKEDLGEEAVVDHTFTCKPGDSVSYVVVLREKYANAFFGGAQGLLLKEKKKTFHLTSWAAPEVEDEPYVAVENRGGTIPQSEDPNEMVGPKGVARLQYVTVGDELEYTVYFENKSDATAAAQEVWISNPLSEYLDWETFTVKEVAFNNQVDLGLDGTPGGTSEVALEGTAYKVRSQVAFDRATGLLDCYIRIVDESTGSTWPDDVYAGFLPPNDESRRGEGHVTYRVKLREDAPAWALVTNTASIVFDYNDPIETDPSWWNTVLVPLSINEILDADNVHFRNDAASAWEMDLDNAHAEDDRVSFRSGPVGEGEETALTMRVAGPGTLAFWWRCQAAYGEDSEGLFPVNDGTVRVDGEAAGLEIGGWETEWRRETLKVSGDGEHEVAWVYRKMAEDEAEDDGLWVDAITWVSDWPSLPGDRDAIVEKRADGTFRVTPSAVSSELKVTIPQGVEPSKVAVQVDLAVERFALNGASAIFVRDGLDLTPWLALPSPDGEGWIAMERVDVRPEIALEALDAAQGAEVDLCGESPVFVTAPTKRGLFYTLVEGESLDAMRDGDSTWGDGTSWRPKRSVTDSPSGFYRIKVEK